MLPRFVLNVYSMISSRDDTTRSGQNGYAPWSLLINGFKYTEFTAVMWSETSVLLQDRSQNNKIQYVFAASILLSSCKF